MKTSKPVTSLSEALFFTVLLSILFLCNSNPKAKVEGKESDNIKKIATMTEMTTAIKHNSKKLMIIDLYADWCGPCRLLSPVLETLSKEYTDSVIFYKVNVDNSPEIATMFGVQGIPCVVFIKNEEPFYSLTGLQPKETYQNVITKCSSAESAAACQKQLQL
jgi:thioredoxin 1